MIDLTFDGELVLVHDDVELTLILDLTCDGGHLPASNEFFIYFYNPFILAYAKLSAIFL